MILILVWCFVVLGFYWDVKSVSILMLIICLKKVDMFEGVENL